MNMKRVPLFVIGVSLGMLQAEAVSFRKDIPSPASWNCPTNWSGDVKPGVENNAEFGWDSKPSGTYYVSLDAPQLVAGLTLTEWKTFPSPFYIGTQNDRLCGNTLSLQNVTRHDYTSGSSYIGVDVILTGDSTWNVKKGYNGEMTVEGSISGPYSLTKTGDANGLLVLAARNTYTGTTTVSAGTLQLGNGTDPSRGSGVAGEIVNNASLVCDPARGDVQTIGDLSGTGSFQKKGLGTVVFAGTNSLSSTGSFELTQHKWDDYGAGSIDCVVTNGVFAFSSYTFTYDFNYLGSQDLDLGSGPVTLKKFNSESERTIGVLKNTLTIGGPISGSMKFTKGGRGAMVLEAASSWTGGTSVNGGKLQLDDAGTLGTGALTVGADGTLVLGAAAETVDRISDASAVGLGGVLIQNDDATETAGALTLKAGPAVIRVADEESTSGFTFASYAGREAGNTTVFDLAGESSVSFATATAGTVIPGAIIKRGASAAPATIDADGKVVALTADGSTNVKTDLTGDLTLTGANYGTLELCNDSGSAVTVTIDGTLTTDNGLYLSGSSPIVVTGGSIGGNTDGEAIIVVASSATVTIASPVSSDNITFGGVGDLVISGNLTAKASGGGYINVNVDGDVTWGQKNASCGATRFFNGVTTFASGAKLYEANSQSSGKTCYLRIGCRAKVDLNGVSVQSNGLTGLGELTNGSATACTYTCAWYPAGSNWQDFQPDFSGNITGNLSLSITCNGYYENKYTQYLSGDNTFTGKLTKSGGGTLTLSGRNALGNAALYMNGATLNAMTAVNVTSSSCSFKSFTYAGSTPLDLSSAPAYLNAAAVTMTVNGKGLAIGGLGEVTAGSTLTKAGTGTLTIKGDSTYTGATAVSAGTLEIKGKLASRNATVASGATLTLSAEGRTFGKVEISVEDGGTICLPSKGRRYAKSLTVNGVSMPAGVSYGAIGSGAVREMDCFSGPGIMSLGEGLVFFIR